jgi:general stress protein 26
MTDTASSETQLSLIFIANNRSHKFEELANESNVNVSFYDNKTTNWASFAGVAKVSQDKELISKHWSSTFVLFFCSSQNCEHKAD